MTQFTAPCMDNMQQVTRIRKGLYGWSGKTEIRLAEDSDLLISVSTGKNSSGNIISSLQVAKLEDGFVSYIVFQDYHRSIIVAKARCTELVVRTQHYNALKLVAEHMPAINAQYNPVAEVQDVQS